MTFLHHHFGCFHWLPFDFDSVYWFRLRWISISVQLSWFPAQKKVKFSVSSVRKNNFGFFSKDQMHSNLYFEKIYIWRSLRTCNKGGIVCWFNALFAPLEFSCWFAAFVRLFDINKVPSTSDGLSMGNVYEHWYVERPPRVRSSRIASSFMPRCKHFSKRQAGHFFRVAIDMGHGPPRKHT